MRAAHILGSAFPLNDGGLFYAMARDLQANHYLLPATTSYNSAGIPFAYPPLGFYLAAALDDLTPLSLLDLFRLLPLAYSTLTIAAAGLLARRLLRDDRAALAAALAFALIPRSFIWLLMGGGVARGLGLLAALLALHEAHRLLTTGRRGCIVTLALLAAATLLSHAETAWFLAFSVAILWAGYGRTRDGLLRLTLAGTLAMLCAAPWWLAVLGAHGLDPFRSANATGGNVFSTLQLARDSMLALARLTATSEPLFPLLGALGLLGALVSIRSRHLQLPAWWLLIVLLDARAFPTFTTIPVAMLAGLALVEVVLPAAGHLWHRPLRGDAHGWLAAPRGAALVAVALLLYAGAGALVRAPGFNGEGHFLRGLTPAERGTMAWIEANTPPDASVLILPRGPWPADREGEWFPVLADRHAAATVQGTEWLGHFTEAVRAHDKVWDCGYHAAGCLTRWGASTGIPFTHVYLPTTEHGPCCSTLLDSLRDSQRTGGPFRTVHEGPGGSVFAVRGGPAEVVLLRPR